MEPFFFFTTSAEVVAEVASLRLFALWLEPTFVEPAEEDEVKALLARPANEELCGKASFGSWL